MADLTREQIEKWLQRANDGHALRLSKSDGEALCAMALRALDAEKADSDRLEDLAEELRMHEVVREAVKELREVGLRAINALPPPFTGDPATLDDRAAQRLSFAAGNVAIDRDPDARRTGAVEDNRAEADRRLGAKVRGWTCSRCGSSGRLPASPGPMPYHCDGCFSDLRATIAAALREEAGR